MKRSVRCPVGNWYDAAVHAECPCPSCWAERSSSVLASQDTSATERIAASVVGLEKSLADNSGRSRESDAAQPLRAEAELRSWKRLSVIRALAVGGVFVLSVFLIIFSGVACRMFGAFCDSETIVFEQVKTCAEGKTCGVAVCTNVYRQAYANGRYGKQIEDIERSLAHPCRTAEDTLYDEAAKCAQDKETGGQYCELKSCFVPLLTQYPNSRKVAAEERRIQNADQTSRLSQEQLEFDVADDCASRQPCSAAICFAKYQRDYPNGQLQPKMDAALVRAQSSCKPIPPPAPPLSKPSTIFVPRKNEKPSFDCVKGPKKPVDEMICADGELAKADGELGAVYNDKRALLKGAERQAFTASEFAWIEERDRECAVPKSGAWNTRDLLRAKDCLLEKTRSRREELSQR